MRNDLERYEHGQVYLLTNGDFVLITSVDELNRVNNSDKTRRCYCKLGHKYIKGEQVKDHKGNLLIIETDKDSIVTIDTSKSVTFTITELKNKEAYYLGKLSDDKLNKYNLMNNDFDDDDEW